MAPQLLRLVKITGSGPVRELAHLVLALRAAGALCNLASLRRSECLAAMAEAVKSGSAAVQDAFCAAMEGAVDRAASRHKMAESAMDVVPTLVEATAQQGRPPTEEEVPFFTTGPHNRAALAVGRCRIAGGQSAKEVQLVPHVRIATPIR